MIEQLDILTNPAMRATILTIAAGFMVLEYLLSRLARHDAETHDLGESAASFGVALGQNLLRAIEAGIVAVPFAFAYNHRLFDPDPFTPATIATLFVATEFVYYWQHRAAHRIRWMWATHAVHHSTTRLNFTAAIRLGWTGSISGNFLFFLPLAWAGFHPIAIVAMLSVNLLYQFFIHTQLVPRLGPLEWVLNTPAHHRVHHASNEACLDKNFGGILIVFDRLFGTFAEKPNDEPLRYGLAGGASSCNPLRIAFGEWIAMFGDVRNAASLRGKLRAMFAPPGSLEPIDRHTAAATRGPGSTGTDQTPNFGAASAWHVKRALIDPPTVIAIIGMLGLLAMVIGSVAARAQASPEMREQTRTVARICRSDFGRLCAGVQPGGGRVLACLQKHVAELSPQCRAALPGTNALRSKSSQATAPKP